MEKQATQGDSDSAAMSKIIAILAVAALIVVLAVPFLSTLSAPTGNGVQLDPTFKIPPPPVDAIYHPTATKVLTAIMFALGGISVIIGLVDSIRRKNPVPFVLTLSAAGLIAPEIYVEMMGACYYPTSPDNVAFTILGRQMSWFIVGGWLGFAAPFLYLSYWMFRKGVSDRTLWLVFLIAGLSSVPIEETLLHFEVYYYYGNQPLVLFAKHPFWWMPCNAGGIFLAAALAYRFESKLQGWRSLAILLLTPMALGGVYGFIAMPSWIVVNGNYSWLVTQAAGLLTLAMGFAAIALTIKLVVRGAPA